MTERRGPVFEYLDQRAEAEALAKSAEEAALRVQYEAASKSAEDWRSRWFLSLAVGNGALAAGLASRLPEAGKALNLWFVLLPALWLAVVGLLVSGAIPYFWTKRLSCYRDYVWAQSAIAAQANPETAKFTMDGGKARRYVDYLLERVKMRGRWEKAVVFGEVAASLFFVLSVGWVLVTLTLGK